MASKNGIGKIASVTSLHALPRSAHVCLRCQRLASNAASKPNATLPIPPTTRRHTSSSSLTDRLRSRIWGTDTPPGQENPYGAPGYLEQRRKDKEANDRAETTKETEILSPSQIATEPGDEDIEDVSEESDATTWEGMPVVGGPGWGMEEWDEQHPYEGYMVNPKSESREEIVSIIHRALAEVMVLRQVNLPLEIDKDAKYTTNEYVQRIAKGARFQVTHENQVSLLLEDEALQDAILDCINPKEAASEGSVSQEENSLENDQREEKPGSLSIVAAEESIGPTAERGEIDVSTPEEAEAVKYEALPEEHHLSQITEDPSLYTPVDDSWRGVALTHPGFKFAVLKRVMQLSGRRIPDPDIQSIHDSGTLFTHLVKKPKPKKLADALFASDVVDLPNIDIRERRYTPIDKEKEIGRWKVIERELEARDLPLTGKGLVAVGDPVT